LCAFIGVIYPSKFESQYVEKQEIDEKKGNNNT
jgi:hypothetical protein